MNEKVLCIGLAKDYIVEYVCSCLHCAHRNPQYIKVSGCVYDDKLYISNLTIACIYCNHPIFLESPIEFKNPTLIDAIKEQILKG